MAGTGLPIDVVIYGVSGPTQGAFTGHLVEARLLWYVFIPGVSREEHGQTRAEKHEYYSTANGALQRREVVTYHLDLLQLLRAITAQTYSYVRMNP